MIYYLEDTRAKTHCGEQSGSIGVNMYHTWNRIEREDLIWDHRERI